LEHVRTPTQRALKLVVDARCECPPSPSWRRGDLAVGRVTHGSHVDDFGYIHPTGVGQCCAAWSYVIRHTVQRLLPDSRSS